MLLGKNAYFLHAMSGHPLSNELRHSMEGNSHKIGKSTDFFIVWLH